MKDNKNSKVTASLVVVVIVLVVAVLIYSNKKTVVNNSNTNESNTPNVVVNKNVSYKDGTYSVKGNYVTPGGERDIDVTITLEDGVVTDTTFKGNAEDPTSKRFQGEFGDNYKEMVVGKNISDLSLTKVSGSSLTPQGFNDALERVKEQAEI